MSKTVYVTVEALIKLFNEDYGMRLPKNTRFILTSEINKEKEQSYIADLQSQLTEKDKQLENAQNLKAIEVADELSLKLSKIHNQDKISFAIAEFEKVKRLLNCDYRLQETNYTYTEDYYVCLDIINEYIDQQINELKGKVEDVKD